MQQTLLRRLAPLFALFVTTLPCACATTGLVSAASDAQSAHGLIDNSPRIAIATAYDPEFSVLLPSLQQSKEHKVHGVSYWTGELGEQPVILFKTGVSIVNATMNTQRLLGEFNITQIVVSGVAGGLDPDLSIGDVTAPACWAKYDEATYLRETEPGVFKAPFPGVSPLVSPYGFMGTRGVRIATTEDPNPAPRLWFEADSSLLAIAEAASSEADFQQCDQDGICLPGEPDFHIGGAGVSGSVFMDNGAYRDYLHTTFDAQVVEMETAAIAMVAHSNELPFIAFRSVSDLAGGGSANQNEIRAFEHLAAQNSAALVIAFLERMPKP
ncbi:5'-methylthioadenosine/S-adenosylhomocysteine nucleosidase [uncultured Hyphomonas sp.]|uniref:5'-methylthioadenosine/S-adenosylhomocysteine nucleosidase n=1 Tax=uncultured Hyphomonas sp. TaxID=225298 RepID=UPI002AAB7C52|nr:5'-methylthioadenosine/S-adenosylhomocysteine nucleosidase [uncultured Hyphomonas sp.]